jgi:hypothetical protein
MIMAQGRDLLAESYRYEYCRYVKILDPEFEKISATLDDVIRTCENLHVEEQHQLKTLPQKYENLLIV